MDSESKRFSLKSMLTPCFVLVTIIGLVGVLFAAIADTALTKQQGSGLSGATSGPEAAAPEEKVSLSDGQAALIRRDADTGVPRSLSGPVILPAADNLQAAALAFLNQNKDQYKMSDPYNELLLKKQQSDGLGMTHLRFEQVYQGLPVFQRVMLVHFTPEGHISSINGEYAPGISLNPTPTVPLATAIRTAEIHLHETAQPWSGEQPALGVYIHDDRRVYLTWKITLVSDQHSFGVVYFIDAHGGSIVASRSNERTQKIHRTTWIAEGTENTLNKVLDDYLGPHTTTNKVAQITHDNVGITYDYFWNTFGRDSYDDAGSEIKSIVSYYRESNPCNAWADWLNKRLKFSDGDGETCRPYGYALDVVAHEFTHFVDKTTAKLAYQFEHGALSESYADVMSAMVDRDDWLHGEELYTDDSPDTFIRSLSNPSLYDQPAHMSDKLITDINDDYGGIHTNSGIPNRAAYNVAMAIGREKMEQIWYRTLSEYLTTLSEFDDAREQSIQAARDLYGTHSVEEYAVTNGFCMVGIGDCRRAPYNGGFVFTSFRDGNSEIYSMNADGTGLSNLSNHPSSDTEAVWSPFGDRIAFTSTRDGNSEIYVMNADGSDPINISNNGAIDKQPAWSPDGAWLAFSSNRDGNYSIYMASADGSAEVIRMTDIPRNDYEPAWSPDGNWIAFSGDGDIYLISADRTHQLHLVAHTAYDGSPDWHANGQLLAFNSYRTGNMEIYTINIDGSGLTNITNNAANDYAPSWSPVGTSIAFYSTRLSTYADIFRMSSDGSGQTRITTHTAVDGDPDWQPQLQRDDYFTWYDNVGGDNWILMANPSAYSNSRFSLKVADERVDMTPFALTGPGCPPEGCAAGSARPGMTLTPRIDGLVGGPVIVSQTVGPKALTSQRTLWPKGGSSLEEVTGFDEDRLSDKYVWPWYDQQSAGMDNWILVTNPGDVPVHYKITIDGNEMHRGTIASGANVTPQFPGVMGGPVEVQAWADAVDGSSPAKIVASQRVLSNHGSAFNEAVGTPQSELSDHYVWPWYDNQGGQNWILLANENKFGDLPMQMFFEIYIDGDLVCSDEFCDDVHGVVEPGPIPSGEMITPMFDRVGGPVEVKTYWRPGHDPEYSIPSIASQRVVWGPSFGETLGYPYSRLADTYHWTWYDQQSTGMQNWVLVANLSNSDSADYQVKVAGNVMDSDTLTPGEMVTPTFPGTMDGPVEVTATGGTVIASQRVLYNGYFNEVLGTVLD